MVGPSLMVLFSLLFLIPLYSPPFYAFFFSFQIDQIATGYADMQNQCIIMTYVALLLLLLLC